MFNSAFKIFLKYIVSVCYFNQGRQSSQKNPSDMSYVIDRTPSQRVV